MKYFRAILRRIGVWAVFGGSLAGVATPALSHDRSVHLSIGIGIPQPVEVVPAPVIVAPAPVVVDRHIVIIKESPIIYRRHHGSSTWKKFRSGSWKKFWKK